MKTVKIAGMAVLMALAVMFVGCAKKDAEGDAAKKCTKAGCEEKCKCTKPAEGDKAAPAEGEADAAPTELPTE